MDHTATTNNTANNTANNGTRLPRQPEPHQRADGPRRLPFWEMGARPDMAACLHDAVEDALDDNRLARPLAMYALHAGKTARSLDPTPEGFEWHVRAENVLSALEKLGGHCFLVEGGCLYLAWPDSIARVDVRRSGEAAGTVRFMSLTTCDGRLLAAVQEARKGWLRPAASEAPKTTVHVLTRSGNHFGLTQVATEDSVLVEGNYVPSTVEAYRRAVEALRSPKPSGRLLVLEGKTGTGKTHMVRALLGALAGAATVILVPEHLVANLAEPAIVPVLVSLSQMRGGAPIVLVLEDCDDCLLSREHTTAQGDRANVATLSAVLNLADGILGAALNLRLVATTNARVEHMDSALLRPGRLIERIEVGPLPRRIALGVVAREAGLSATPDTLDTLDNGLMAGGHHSASITLAEAYEVARHIVARHIVARRAERASASTTSASDTTAQA